MEKINSIKRVISPDKEKQAGMDLLRVRQVLTSKNPENKGVFFKELFSQYKSKVRNVCKFMEKNSIRSQLLNTDIEDIVQDVFLQVYSKLETYRGESPIEHWIIRIAVNQFKIFLRKKKMTDSLASMNEFFNFEKSLEMYRQKNERADLLFIKEFLNNTELLDIIFYKREGMRKIFLMYYKEGKRHEEIGPELGIEPSTSRSQMTKALRHIKAFFKENPDEKTF